MNQREKNEEKSCGHYSWMLASVGLLALMLASASNSSPQSITPLSSAQKKAALASGYGKLPLSFEKNEGQASQGVKFLAHGQGYSLSLTRDGALLVLHKGSSPGSLPETEAAPRISLVGANPNPEIVGTDELPGKVNYLLGNDPKKWRTNLPTFAQVLYKDVYPGIDLVFHGNQGKLEFDFIVHPGANPELIQLESLGAQTHALDQSGDITYEYAGGRITLNRPFSYVSAGTERQEVASSYVIQKNGRISFRLKNYDPDTTLVIDPALGYSTFLGGSTATVYPSGIAVDGLEEAIVVGMAGTTYPMSAGAFQTGAPPAGETYVPFVMKLNASGTALVYATFLGGIEPGPSYTPYPDAVTAVAGDAEGNAYLTGRANSLNFPTTANVFQSTSPCLAANQSNGVCSHAVAFVTELNPTGSGLVFSTFLGGTTATTGTELYAPVQYYSEPSGLIYADRGQLGEAGTGIAVDSTGVYIGGITSSSDFPVTSGAAQTTLTANAWVPFVARLSAGSLIYATYLVSMPSGIIITADGFAIDPSGNAYIAGRAFSNFPTTPGVLQPSFGTTSSTVGDCSYVAKMNPSGSALVYATLFGCAAPGTWQLVYTKAIAADAEGNAYITGGASGSGNPATANLPTTSGAYQTTCPLNTVPPATPSCAANAFVAEINPTGTALVYSTYLGGKASTAGFGIAVSASGEAVVAGETVSAGANTFPTTSDAVQTSCVSEGGNCYGGFVSEMSADGSALVYSTFLSGSAGLTGATAVTVDGPGNIYVAGTTSATGFPTTAGAFDSLLTQPTGGFLLKLGSAATGTVTIQPTTLPAGAVQIYYGPITFTQTGGTGSITWSTTSPLPAGITFVNGVLEGIPTQSGTFPITIMATDSSGNMGTVSLSLFIYAATSATISAQSCSSTPITTFDFGSVPVGTTWPQYICLNNTGTSNLYISFSTLLPSTAIFTASLGTCNILQSTPPSATNGIPPGGSCNVTVNFSPASVGPSAPVELSFADNAGSQTVTLTGTGLALTTAILSTAPCSVSAAPITTLNFGSVPVGTTATQTVCVTGTGSTPLYITAIFPPIVSPFSPVSNSCPVGTPSSLIAVPGGSCQLVISFTPNVPGTSSGIGFQVDDNAGVQTLMLTGTGVVPAPTLGSIAVTPVNPTIGVGIMQQFNAKGTYSDFSTQDITNSVVWSSTSTSPPTTVATINPSTGLATAVAAGTTTIKASFGSATPGSTTLTVTASTGGGGGTPACGCSKTGPYVNPSAAVTSSPNSNYTVSDQVIGSVENVYVYASGSTNAVISTGGTAMGSKLGFSPSGQYFVYENLTSSSSTTLQIFNVYTGKMVYSNSFTFSGTPGLGADMFGVVGLSGFSPDLPETSFVYVFQTGQNSVQWELVHLEQPPTSNTVGSATTVSLTSITSGFWQFNPCGDAIAVVTQPNSSFEDIQLIRTVDGSQVSDTSGIPVGNIALSATSTEQMAVDTTSQGMQPYDLGDNSTVNLGCSAQNAPPRSNVTIQPAATGTLPTGSLPAPVTLNFPSVSSPGGQVSLSVSNTGPAPPPGFGPGNPPNYTAYYDLTTSPSTLSYGTPVTICINYTGLSFAGQPALFHYADGDPNPANITTSVDTINSLICGLTPSLSPFAIFGATGPVSTTTALTSSLSSSVEGQSIILTAQITPGLVGTPTGTVIFNDGGTVLGTGTLTGAGSASINTSLLLAGPNSITATYSGDTYFAGSTSTALALSVTPAPLTVTANPASRQYGAPDPAFTVSYGGFVNGDGPGSLSGALTCTAGDSASTPVGTYAINCSGLSSANYAITFAPGTLTITPAPLTIAANNATRVYGSANPMLTASYAGFVNGDNASVLIGALICSTTATPASPVGTYPIVCSGQSATNYSITYLPGQLAVASAMLTITANNLTKNFDAPNPTLTWTASRFVNGDTTSVLTASPTCTTTATPTSPVGSYPITCSGAAAVNYTFTYVPGMLTVTCHYITIGLSPSTVAEGGFITVSWTLRSCSNATQTVAFDFALSGPAESDSCSATKSEMFATPPFPLQPKTLRTWSFPFRIPKRSCPGTYTTTATTTINGQAVDTSSTSLTITAH